jgi:FkbM family methyltransferase
MLQSLLKLQRKASRACELLIYRTALAVNHRQCEVDGLKLQLPKNVVSTHVAYLLLQGGIDGEDRRLLARYAKDGDFVLNLGGGCGLSAMGAWRQVRPSGAVVTVEPDPLIHDLARRNFHANGMEAIRSHNAAAVADRQTKEITFYRKKNYYGSNLLHTDGQGEAIRVPTIYPPDVVDRTCPGRKILLCDIEGYETSLLAQPEIVDCFDLIITELHFGIYPKDQVSPLVGMFEVLFSRGFKIIDIDDEGFVFEKKPASASQNHG